MRQYSSSLVGRVKNFPLPKNRPLIPLYEAVVNSLHAIEERRQDDPTFCDGKITIEVIRSTQGSLFEDGELPPVEGFRITDNGIGFTEKNIASFVESDSTYKEALGGKGVGRFSWLKAFGAVLVSSIFMDEGVFVKRDFIFSLARSYLDDVLTECPEAKDYSTSVTLDSYLSEYRKDVPKNTSTIAMRIMQHCLVYFLNSNCPQIIIQDILESFVLNNLFKEKVKTDDNTTEFLINDTSFSLLNVKIEDRAFPGNRLYMCANNRLVDSKDLEKLIVDLDGQIFDYNGFWYVGVLTSKYLDEHVDMNRLSFNMPDSGTNLIDDISLEEIVGESCTRIESYLANYLLPITEEKTKRIAQYVTTIAPQFRHLLKYMPDRVAQIKPKLSDDKLDDALYDIKRTFDNLVDR